MPQLSLSEILSLIPQREPFRFVDELLEIDDERAVGAFTFRHDHDFYRGHFPDNPITPGVILIETMVQAAAVPLLCHLLSQEVDVEALARSHMLFTEVEVEFSGVVRPGDRVIARSHKVFYRRRKLRAEVTLAREDGTEVLSGFAAAIAVVP